MKLQRLSFVLLIAALLAPFLGMTQPPPPAPPVDVPFDGISTLLLAAGAGYAIKKGREKRKK